ncbi:MAG: helicase-associated domain-containing protein [Treponema sp.]|nr:helicase-associated domain-containing protein [Treponema sp.]
MIENEIESWQEAVSSLNDNTFFNIMRLYLGDIKTPYNKQRLISQLASFIKNEKNTRAILDFLDEDDVKVLSAISIISKVTKDTLVEFFKDTYSLGQLYSKIINLNERLIIYLKKDRYSSKEYLYINPFLKDALKPYLSYRLVLENPQIETQVTEDSFTISPNFLAAFISYLKIKKISCKADGTIKKNDLNRLEVIFPQKEKCIQLLMTSFINLSLVKEGEKGFELDSLRLEKFAELEDSMQYALLCAAAVSRFSKAGLQKEAQLLLDCIASIPQSGFTKTSILRLAFLVGSYSEDGSAVSQRGRFSQILAAARSEDGAEAVQNADLLDRMISAAMAFGVLQKKGLTAEGEEVYAAGTFLETTNEDIKVLNIDSTFTVSIMPGLRLKKLLPLTDFLLIKKCELVTEYEIVRQSVCYSFDYSWTPEKICAQMEKYSYYELPQNLKINIAEWYASYSSAAIYKGYILKVKDNNITLAENNPKIKPYLKEKLAEGIYLLNIPLDANISSFIEECGFDFLGNLRQSERPSMNLSFPLLRKSQEISMLKQKASYEEVSGQEGQKKIDELLLLLNESDMDENKKENLSHRIKSRMILSKEQLLNASIRSEIIEADGMNFPGKVRLLESSIKEEDMVEIVMPQADGSGKLFTMVGYPKLLSKQTGEAILRFEVEPDKENITILVSKISHIKRMRF